ncbi:hypothetical protein BDR03DRAFT_668127 [Suillus americanus]|nr:hypothetical protein BDR03DRAFT_668127 [Suillus americanus]
MLCIMLAFTSISTDRCATRQQQQLARHLHINRGNLQNLRKKHHMNQMAPRSRVQLQRKTCKWGDVAVWVEAAIRAEARAEEAEGAEYVECRLD